MRFLAAIVLITVAACSWARADAGEPTTLIDRAYSRLYNFDFEGARRILDDHIRQHPSDPLGYAVRAAAYLFDELDRLMILESDFFRDNRRLTAKKKLKQNPILKQKLFNAVKTSQQLAQSRLDADSEDRDALFAMALTTGIETDYAAFVEKRQLASLSHAKESQRYALRLLEAHPTFYDAYLTIGLSEYLYSSLPFFVRWFVHFDQTQGSKEKAVSNLQIVARSGRYLGPFAKILLAVIRLREKMPREAQKLLVELTQEFPENPLFRKELSRLAAANRGIGAE